ncbi:MAG TPA: N-acetylmuramoyl-L-alanine amidase [Flavobacteriales bacterium]|nr:N-acetylmuramoyl-L-alanine amidase [Flavobacteriales bacterium]
MRLIRYIAVHCTDTLASATVESIKNYWKNHLKWKRPGYHYIIKADGEVVKLLDEEKISNGVLGFNPVTVNICYIGGRTKEKTKIDTRTEAQKESMFDLLVELSERYPEAEIKGHCEFPGQGGRTCPNFNVKEWLRNYTPKLEDNDLDIAA